MIGALTLYEPTVLIIADDPEFSRAVIARWQTERTVPTFTALGTDVWTRKTNAACDLVVLGPGIGLKNGTLSLVESTPWPAIYVDDDSRSLANAREKAPRLMVLRLHEGWLDTLVLLGAEALRRMEALRRAQTAEEASAKSHREAVLGRYMLEMRHSLNNALTSVLGNSELLLLEPGALSSGVREQLDTIRNMAVRMHEILQRFSSLDSEMKIAETQSQRAPDENARIAAAS